MGELRHCELCGRKAPARSVQYRVPIGPGEYDHESVFACYRCVAPVGTYGHRGGGGHIRRVRRKQ